MTPIHIVTVIHLNRLKKKITQTIMTKTQMKNSCLTLKIEITIIVIEATTRVNWKKITIKMIYLTSLTISATIASIKMITAIIMLIAMIASMLTVQIMKTLRMKKRNVSNENETAVSSDDAENINQYKRNRSRRTKKPTQWSNPHVSHVRNKGSDENESMDHYDENVGRTLSRMVSHCNNKCECIGENKMQLAQACSLKKGLRALVGKGKEAAYQEMNQTHKRTTLSLLKKCLTDTELKRAMERLTFLKDNRDGRIKGRACADGITQRGHIRKEKHASPTEVTKAMFITGVIESKEECDIMSLDIPIFLETRSACRFGKNHYED